jgi:hypothetical protein
MEAGMIFSKLTGNAAPIYRRSAAFPKAKSNPEMTGLPCSNAHAAQQFFHAAQHFFSVSRRGAATALHKTAWNRAAFAHILTLRRNRSRGLTGATGLLGGYRCPPRTNR